MSYPVFLRVWAAAAAVLMLTSLGGFAEATAETRGNRERPPAFIKGSWIVELAPGTRPSRSRQIAKQHGGRAPFVYDSARGFAFSGSDDAARRLASDRRVRRVERDVEVRLAEHGNAFRPFQRRLRAHLAYHDGNTGRGARVAVLDTGVGSHPRFRGNLDRSTGKACGGGSTGDTDGHGTRTAGNVISVAPRVTIVPVRVFPHNSTVTSLSRVLCGINHVTRLNGNSSTADDIDVANLSLAAPGTCAGAQTFCDAIDRSVDRGAVYTVAAGNNGRNAAGFIPASHRRVITVSSLEGDGSRRIAWFSNFGGHVDVTAPGLNILSPVPGGGWTRSSGTSRSAALVAGVAAIVKAQRPDWDASQVRRVLMKTGNCPLGPNDGGSLCKGLGSWQADRDSRTEPVPDARRAARAAS